MGSSDFVVCTFFGHKDTTEKIKPLLRETLIDLIENKRVTRFYVGHQGTFDRMAKTVLKQLKTVYPHISYEVVIYSLSQGEKEGRDGTQTLFPEGLEEVHPRFALDRRNRWMVEHADYVVTYVERSFGGAAKFKVLAEKKGKTVINLATQPNYVR